MLAEPVKHALYIKLSVDGQGFPKLPYSREAVMTEPLSWSLNPFL